MFLHKISRLHRLLILAVVGWLEVFFDATKNEEPKHGTGVARS